jgi:hypothetical protein
VFSVSIGKTLDFSLKLKHAMSPSEIKNRPYIQTKLSNTKYSAVRKMKS